VLLVGRWGDNIYIPAGSEWILELDGGAVDNPKVRVVVTFKGRL
jgi:hypothetical protein